MKESKPNPPRFQDLDAIDVQLLNELQRDSRITNAELARRVGLSAPAVHARVRRLQDQKYIESFVAVLSRESVDYEVLCFVQVRLKTYEAEHVALIESKFREIEHVLDCYQILGEWDYLIKVAVRDMDQLKQILSELIQVPGIERFLTNIVIESIVERTQLPLDAGDVISENGHG